MLAGGVARSVRDGDWELFSFDPQTGRTVWIMDDDGKTHIRTDYPVTNVLESNLHARNDAAKAWAGDWHRIASVPLNLHYDENAGLHKALTDGDDAHVRRFLNDGDNAAWRTKEGRV